MKQGVHPLSSMGQQINPFASQNQQQQQNQNQNNNQMPPQIWSNPPPPQQGASQQQQQQVQQSAPPQPVITAQVAAQIEAVNAQQNVLREQIRQSELNLTAQHGVWNLTDSF